MRSAPEEDVVMNSGRQPRAIESNLSARRCVRRIKGEERGKFRGQINRTEMLSHVMGPFPSLRLCLDGPGTLTLLKCFGCLTIPYAYVDGGQRLRNGLHGKW